MGECHHFMHQNAFSGLILLSMFQKIKKCKFQIFRFFFCCFIDIPIKKCEFQIFRVFFLLIFLIELYFYSIMLKPKYVDYKVSRFFCFGNFLSLFNFSSSFFLSKIFQQQSHPIKHPSRKKHEH